MRRSGARGRSTGEEGVTYVKFPNTSISPRKIAKLCGPPFTDIDIFNAGDEMGLKTAYARYGRREARLIVAKLMVRASDPDVIERLLVAYNGLNGESKEASSRPPGRPARRSLVRQYGPSA